MATTSIWSEPLLHLLVNCDLHSLNLIPQSSLLYPSSNFIHFLNDCSSNVSQHDINKYSGDHFNSFVCVQTLHSHWRLSFIITSRWVIEGDIESGITVMEWGYGKDGLFIPIDTNTAKSKRGHNLQWVVWFSKQVDVSHSSRLLYNHAGFNRERRVKRVGD